ncbi:tellurite resistance protein [Rhizobium sp. BK181]|uniref:dicarboxylate transporter/tellurite-resistance protein TehA n=1 Tax=Rhizobium sp. BK181 TaxID=2587072 RepID=UPI0017C3B69C|nr:dicarboxylate transporter/tellurite-resistance protein TehA [Rhizobium sp. BK181]MBB3318368.1 tellurite resistance protein [Rhizobium sp. BK181]
MPAQLRLRCRLSFPAATRPLQNLPQIFILSDLEPLWINRTHLSRRVRATRLPDPETVGDHRRRLTIKMEAFVSRLSTNGSLGSTYGAVLFPRVQASYFGCVLGLSGLATNWRLAAELWRLPTIIGEALYLCAGAIWVVFSLLFLTKWALARDEALAEFSNPVQSCFVGLLGVSSMLIALGVLPYSWLAGVSLFAFGAIFTVVFGVWLTGSLWEGNRDPVSTTAALYLPAGAGSFVTAIAASAFGHSDWSQLAFGAGFFSWLAIESVVLHRLLTNKELPELLRPMLGIQLAPPAVGCLAYLSGTTGHPDPLSHALFGYGLLQLLILARLIPWIRRQPLDLSYWGITFGLTALTSASMKMAARTDGPVLGMIAPFLLIISSAIVLAIAIGSIRWLLKR